MSTRSTVFSQIMRYLDPTEFARCAAQFPSPRKPRGPSAYDHFLALCFAQLTYRESLRDIVACLNARSGRTYFLGFRSRITRTGLAYANNHRDARVFASVAQVIMRKAHVLFKDDASPDPELPASVYALDASIIDLAMSLFPWAHWQTHAKAVKLHTLFSLRGHVPAWAIVTEATCPEQKTLDLLPLEPGAFYVMDRGYLDFQRLNRLDQAEAFFVVRSKCHVRFRVLQSRPVEKSTGLRCDQTVRLVTKWSRRFFPQPLRRVRVRDQSTNRSLVLLTNCFEMQPHVVSELYRRRWQVELFFKWIKQHLRLRSFFGRTPNAVQAQVWAAICAYLLVAIMRRVLRLPQTLHQILQIVSVSAFEQVPVAELLAKEHCEELMEADCNQLSLSDL